MSLAQIEPPPPTNPRQTLDDILCRIRNYEISTIPGLFAEGEPDDSADAENVGKATVSEICSEMAELPKANKSAAEHATDFDPPAVRDFTRNGTKAGKTHGWGFPGIVLKSRTHP